MKNIIRKYLWRLLGFDYQMMLDKTDYTLLKNDSYSKFGNHSYSNGAKVWRWTKAPLIIGKYCSIAHDVNFIVDEGHHTISPISNFPLANNLFKEDDQILGKSKQDFISQFKQKEGITIGNDVWIGMGSFILPGITIGNGVTIAANSVVTKDISDYTIVAGVPAKKIKTKHDNKSIKMLNKIAWWDWNDELIKKRINDFYKPMSDFLEKYYNNENKNNNLS